MLFLLVEVSTKGHGYGAGAARVLHSLAGITGEAFYYVWAAGPYMMAQKGRGGYPAEHDCRDCIVLCETIPSPLKFQ